MQQQVSVRWGSGGSQSSHAGRASSRASGSTYRKPKGRQGDKNPFHVKESMPELPRFSDARLPAHIRRKLRAEAEGAGAGAGGRRKAKDNSVVDFEVQDAAVVRVKGKDSKRPKLTRVKTPLHRALRLKAAQEQAARNAQGGGVPWAADEQAAAEREAERFVEAQLLEEEAAVERAALQARLDEEGTPAAEALATLAAFDKQAAEAVQQALAESDAAYAQAMDEAADEADADADAETGAAADKPATAAAAKKRAARKQSKAAAPAFGIQTVLKFLKEYDFSVQLPPKKKRAGAAEEGAPEDAADAAHRAALSNPLNQSLLVYDVATRFHFSDYLVVVKASSARQMRHLAESTYKMARALDACALNPRVLTLEGRDREDWMLVDAGHIWLYFFNQTPAVSLPAGVGGVFGVNFDVAHVNVNFSSATSGSHGRASEPAPQQLPFLLNHNNNTVSFVTHTNPFNPMGGPASVSASASASSSASPDLTAASYAARARAHAAAPASSGNSSVPFDADMLPHETSSQINSSMWFEPTPDSPAHRKKSQINMAQAKRQMMNNSNTVDASYSAVAEPVHGSSPFLTSSGGGGGGDGDGDPMLSQLRASNFTHPVLENLERTYGDLRVPPSKVSRLRDYQHEDLRNGVVLLATDDADADGNGKKRKRGAKSGVESIEVQDADSTVHILRTECKV